MLRHSYLALEEHKSAVWSSSCHSPMQMVVWRRRMAVCLWSIRISCKIKMPFVWVVGVQPHTYGFTSKKKKQQQPNSFSCTASQSELVRLSKLGPAHVCGLLWFTVWGRWRTGCHFPRGTPPLLHFLIDLTDRHFQVSNYHCGAELIPPSSLPLSPGPSMKHTANCSIALLMTQSVQNKGEQQKVETKLMW